MARIADAIVARRSDLLRDLFAPRDFFFLFLRAMLFVLVFYSLEVSKINPDCPAFEGLDCIGIVIASCVPRNSIFGSAVGNDNLSAASRAFRFLPDHVG
jgi:hypothetical protein